MATTRAAALALGDAGLHVEEATPRGVGHVATYPLVLSPAAEKPAVPHGEDPGGIPYTLTWSLVGYPAVVVRAGTSVAGMPIGVLVASAPWCEDLALAAAAIVERALGGWRAPSLD